MFRRPRPEEVEERPVFTRGERAGSAIAHAAPLLVAVPLFFLLGNIGFALLPSPMIAYIISRYFRTRQSVWGAFQGMQATFVHLILVILVFVASFTGGTAMEPGTTEVPLGLLIAFVLTFLLFLYTLWGAWDTAWGYDFRYIFISNLVDRVTAANLRRQEFRRQRREAQNRNQPPGSLGS